MSYTEMFQSNGKWIAMVGNTTKSFQTMEEAVEWIEEQQEKERKNGKFD